MLKQPTIKSILIISLTLFFSQSAYAINGWGGWWSSVNMKGYSDELHGNFDRETKFAYYVTFVNILEAEAYGRCYNPAGGTTTANGLPFKAIQASTAEINNDNNDKPTGKGKDIRLEAYFGDDIINDSVVCENNNGQGRDWSVMWAVYLSHLDDVKVGKCYKERNNCKDSEGNWIQDNFEIMEHDIFDCAFDDAVRARIEQYGEKPQYEDAIYFCNKQ